MIPTLRNILAVIIGIIIGSIVNMGLIQISGSIIPPPDGTDMTTMEGIKAAMPLLEAKHFLMPFLAHALGTLVGAAISAKIAATRKMTFALVIGFFFFFGGVANAYMLPAPSWFVAVDLVLAYIPMAWIGGKLAGAK